MEAFKEMVSEIEKRKEFWDQEFSNDGKKLESGFEFALDKSLHQILFWFRSHGFHFRKENQILHHPIQRITLRCAASYKKRYESENLSELEKKTRKSFTKRLPKEKNCSMAISLKKVDNGPWTICLFRNSHSYHAPLVESDYHCLSYDEIIAIQNMFLDGLASALILQKVRDEMNRTITRQQLKNLRCRLVPNLETAIFKKMGANCGHGTSRALYLMYELQQLARPFVVRFHIIEVIFIRLFLSIIKQLIGFRSVNWGSQYNQNVILLSDPVIGFSNNNTGLVPGGKKSHPYSAKKSNWTDGR